MGTRADADFSPATRKAIARAVNHQCSVPLCKNPAIGADDGKTIDGGTACHIYSAGKNGPRGRGGLNESQLAKASNGLWCCAYHGRVIDANQGSSFPAAQLFMWKRLAEGRVRRAMAVEYAELGWIHSFSLSLETDSGKSWTAGATLEKNNLLSAPTGTGKSLALEALGSISQGRHARRLRQFRRYSIDLAYETLTREAVAHVSCNHGQQLQRRLAGAPAILGPTDIVVLYFNPDAKQSLVDWTGVGHLTHLLGVDEEVLYALTNAVSANPNSGMSINLVPLDPDDFEPDQDVPEGALQVVVKLGRSHAELPFNALSSSERIRVAGALLIALARNEAKARPVLLCVDALWQLDDRVFQSELARLAEEHIQLIVVTPYELTPEQVRRDFANWKLLDLPSIENALAYRELK